MGAVDAPRTVSLGGGRVVPYPEPTSPAATKVGQGNVRTGTKPEIELRSALHRLGFRFRKDRLVRAGAVRTHPDLVFPTQRLAVFVDGCFWHACPDHHVPPKSNRGYWGPKLAANVERDRRVDAALAADGWTVVRIWEHEPLPARIGAVVAALRAAGHPRAQRVLEG
jgi:DNA mismatch endonuclease (patch repair protein)